MAKPRKGRVTKERLRTFPALKQNTAKQGKTEPHRRRETSSKLPCAFFKGYLIHVTA